MGYVRHDAVIVTIPSYAPVPDIEAFRNSLPEEWRALVVGPVESVVNGDHTVAFLPDGSKEGWDKSDAGDEYRRRFLGLFPYRLPGGQSPYEVVSIRYGRDRRDFEPELIVDYGDGKRLTSNPDWDDDEEDGDGQDALLGS
jgi:hypothetical protein